MKRQLAGLTILTLAALQGCKTGYNRTNTGSSDANPPECATTPADSNLSDQGLKVFNLVAGLTCANKDYADGYLVGQSLGSGNQLNLELGANDPNNHSYERLINGFDNITTHRPAIAAIDYESTQLFTETELKEANLTLKEHWDAGGLVSISWMPLSPWQNDFADIEGNRGTADDRLFDAASGIDLADLLDNSTDVYNVWRNKLNAMAVTLKDLQDKGVVVLWRPLPEMNNDTYWWGTEASNPSGKATEAKLYTDLWVDMFEFFTEFEGGALHNLLWVYSPGETQSEYAITWGYPGDEYVDVVAGIARNDQLSIKDYNALVALGRPVAMAEYSPNSASDLVSSPITNANERGSFDNLTYADRLKESYPAVAYWISNHSGLVDTNTRSNLALVDNQNAKGLMERNYIFSVEKMVDKKMRE